MTTQTRYELFCHPLFLAVAGGLNFPPLIFGILGYATWCSNFSSWLVSNASLSLLNVLGALYFVYKIRKSYKPPYPREESNCSDEGFESEPEVGVFGSDTNDSIPDEGYAQARGDDRGRGRTFIYRLLRRRTTSSDRIRHLLCYDGFAATYSILFLFWVAWLSEGTQRLYNYDNASEEDKEGCIEFHEHYMHSSIVFGFSYVGCVFVALLGSLWQ